jgi:hypothetical protein
MYMTECRLRQIIRSVLIENRKNSILKESNGLKKSIHVDMFTTFCELTFYLKNALLNEDASHSVFFFIASKILRKTHEPIYINENFISKSKEFLKAIGEVFSVYKNSLDDDLLDEKNINVSNYLDENYSFRSDSRIALEKYFSLVLYLKSNANFQKCLNVLKKRLKSISIFDEFNINNVKGKQLINTATEFLNYFSKVNKLLDKNKKDFPSEGRTNIVKVLKVIDRYLEKLPKSVDIEAQEIFEKGFILQRKWMIFTKTIESEDKVIYTEQPFDLSRISSIALKQGLKPDGVWYSFGNDWDDFCQQNRFNTNKYNFKYLIEVDESKIFTISDESDLKQFESLYYIEPDEIGLDYIDWGKVENDGYSGFQIKNWDTLMYKAIKNMQTGQNWLSKYDISSGCIWNKNVVIDFHDLSYKYTPAIFARNKQKLENL